MEKIQSPKWTEKWTRYKSKSIWNSNGVGIDPGVNFGVTFITSHEVISVGGRLDRGDNAGMAAFSFAHEILPDWIDQGTIVVLEGASYNERFGQVELAEVRFGFELGLHLAGITVKVIPPATIRKRVFGNGRLKAGEVWIGMNNNAADSIPMAILSSQYN